MLKPAFCECVETRSFLVFANNSRSNQNEKIMRNKKILLQILLSKKCVMYAKCLAKNIKLYDRWSPGKLSIFQTINLVSPKQSFV